MYQKTLLCNNTPMKVVIAPQVFKGGLSGMEAALAIQQGVLRVYPDAENLLLPVADGGDGTLEALVGPSGSCFEAQVTGPLGESVRAQWGVMPNGKTAVIEMARASGLALVPPERRDPRITTSYGAGELIREALDKGCREIIIGVGGSATNDAGAGIAQALGARLTDADGKQLRFGGAALSDLSRIELDSLDTRLRECRIRVAADVNNPLCGPLGAAAVYGPQKGATAEMVGLLDSALGRFAEIVERDLEVDLMHMPGAGAAGGAGGGLVALLGARLESGAALVCDALHLEEHLQGADLVIVGEGRMDAQTVYNKAPIVVAQRARKLGVPVIAVAGSLGEGYLAVLEHGINDVEIAAPPDLPLDEALRRAGELVAEAAERVVRRYRKSLS